MADHSLPPRGNEEIPSPLKLQRSFYSLAALYAISYGSISTTNYYFTFGSRPGASEASIEQADSVFQLVNSLYPALWLIFLFFVPAFMDALGPRNSFTLMMFAWAIAFCFLVGAFVIADGGPSPLIPIFGIMYSIFIGCFAGLGYTASESYLDYCAEWMPIALSVNSDEISVKEQLSNDAAENQAMNLAEELCRHKAVASKFKNRFASHLYAIIEVGSIIFSLPPVIGGDSAMLPLTISIAVCLFIGAISALFLYDIQPPPEHIIDQNLTVKNSSGEIDHNATESGHNSFLVNALRSAAKSFIGCFTCLSAYRWLAALAIVPYFFVGQFAWSYIAFIIQGDQCGLRDPPEGVGISGIGMTNLIGGATQAITSFFGPLMVGSGKYQFKEYVYPMAIGYIIGLIGPVLVIALGGINDALCGSYGTQIVLQVLNSIPYAINNSVGVAAVLCWYDGPYQHLAVPALVSRSVWTNLGAVVAPLVYTDSFGLQAGGVPCAVMTIVLYLFAAICVPAAHMINTCQTGKSDGEIPETNTTLTRVRRMSAGFTSIKED